MRLSAPIFKLKRQAKLLVRDQNIPLHEALDRVAVTDGFRSWSHLASTTSEFRPAEQIIAKLSAGDMLLLGARPGHGKMLLGLELAVLASRIGRRGLFFTLDYNEGDVLDRFNLAAQSVQADVVMRVTGDCPLIDPEICAQVLWLMEAGVDYASNVWPRGFPKGYDCEVFTIETLDRARSISLLSFCTDTANFEVTDKRVLWLTDGGEFEAHPRHNLKIRGRVRDASDSLPTIS